MPKFLAWCVCILLAGPLVAQPKESPHPNLVKRLGTTAYLLPEQTRHLALAPNGAMVAALVPDNQDTRIVLFSVKTGERLREFTAAKTSGNFLAFSADSQELVLVCWDQLVRFTVRGERTTHFNFKDVDLRLPALSADRQIIAIHAAADVIDRDILLFESKSGRPVGKLPSKGTWCTAMQFSGQGDKLLAAMDVATRAESGGLQYGGNATKMLVAIDVKTQRIVGDMKLEGEHRLALGVDGETVALAKRDDEAIKLVNLRTGKEQATIKTKALEMQFTPDGANLLTVDDQGQVTRWNATTGAKIHDMAGTLTNKDGAIIGSHEGLVVVRDGGWRSTAKFVVWDAKGQRTAKPSGHEGAVTHAVYTPDGSRLITGSMDRTVHLWDSATGQHLKRLTTHREEVKALAVSPNGKLVASACQTGTVHVTRLADGASVSYVNGQPQEPTALTFSHDSRTLYLGGVGNHLDILHLTEPVTRSTIPFAGTNRTHALSKGWLLTSDYIDFFEAQEVKCQLWPLGQKQPSHSITLKDDNKDGWKGSIRCDGAGISADGRFLATSQISEYQGIRPSYGAARLQLWEASSGQSVRVVAPVVTQTLALAPNGRLLVATSEGRSGHLRIGYGTAIEFWDTLTGAKLDTFPLVPTSMTFSPDGRFLAIGGRDHGVTIWRVPTPPAPKPTTYPARVVDGWWALLDAEAATAYQAIAQMLAAPDVAVDLLRSKVAPVEKIDDKVTQALIAQLDSDKFAERERAEKQLRELGEQVAHIIEAALQGKPSAERQARLERLQAAEASPERRRQQRAIAALEWLGTKDAKEHLAKLAAGAPNAFVTREASAALVRLGVK